MPDRQELSKFERIARGAALALAGPSGMFVVPTLAIASKLLEQPLTQTIPAAGAIFAVLAGISEHLAGDATRNVITSLKVEGNHDLEFILASSIRAALTEAHQEIGGSSRLLAETFDGWFSLWDVRLSRGLRNSEDTALLFHTDDAVDPVKFATATTEAWWPSFRSVLLRWAAEQRDLDDARASVNLELPPRLDHYLSEHLLEFAHRAQSLGLRNERNERAWKAWQQRFFEALAKGLLTQAQVAEKQNELLKEVLASLVEIRTWLAEIRAAKSALRLTGSAPPPPGLFVGRDQVVADLRKRLLPASLGPAGTVQLLTAVRGWPGVGKTTVAAALAHDEVLAAAFPDGLLWASLGQTPDIIGQLDIWARELGGALLERRDPLVASRQLAAILREKRMLLIVDDVWAIEEARPFVVGGNHCSTIITTRLTNVAEALAPTPGQVYWLEVLTEEQSLDLLKQLAPEVVDRFPDQCRLLASELEGLPLALQVAGRLIQSEWYRGFGVDQLLNDLRGPNVMCERSSGMLDSAPSATISALFRKSTDVLSPDLRDSFAVLSEFAPKPATFSLKAMKDAWLVDDPSRIARQLIDHGLLEPAGPGRYQMHALLVLHAKALLSD